MTRDEASVAVAKLADAIWRGTTMRWFVEHPGQTAARDAYEYTDDALWVYALARAVWTSEVDRLDRESPHRWYSCGCRIALCECARCADVMRAQLPRMTSEAVFAAVAARR